MPQTGFTSFIINNPFIRRLLMFLALRQCALAATLVAALAPRICSADDLSPSTIAFPPFSSTNINPNDLKMIVDGIRKKVDAQGQFICVTAFPADSVKAPCSLPACISEIAKRTGAGFVVGGDVGRIGSLYTITTTLHRADGSVIGSREIAYEGSIESFYQQVVPQAATVIAGYASGKQVAASLNSSTSSTTDGDIEQAPEEFNDEENSDAPGKNEVIDIGIVKAFSAGMMARAAIGDLRSSQSRYSLLGMVLFPTTSNGQLRIKFGVPMSLAPCEEASRDYPDPLLSVEHEWGFKGFGITAGAAFMYLDGFNRNGFAYDNSYAANWILGIRGGKANAGFRGRVSWAIPFLMDRNGEAANTFLEYSAMGMFGNPRIKGGIGVQGMFKTRQVEYRNYYNSYYYGSSYYDSSYYYTTTEKTNEYFVMVPCGKVAFKTTENVVTSLSLDLGQILFLTSEPDAAGWWGAPSIRFDIVFSLKPLSGPSTYDGTF